MVGSIRPVVYRRKNLSHWTIAVALHIAGNGMGAAIVGFVASLLGFLALSYLSGAAPVVFGGLASLSFAYALDELGLLRLPHLNRGRQVPSSWRALYHPFLTALLYGLGLGTGVFTRVATGMFYVVLLAVAIHGQPSYGTLVLSSFGLARGISVALAGWALRHVQSSEEFLPKLDWLIARSDLVHLVAGTALGCVSGYWMTTFAFGGP